MRGDDALTSTDPSAVVESPPANMVSLVVPGSDAAVADEVVIHLLCHTRYLLALKGRPPFRLAGIETFRRLQGVAALTEDQQWLSLAATSTGYFCAIAMKHSALHSLRESAKRWPNLLLNEDVAGMEWTEFSPPTER